VKIAERVREIRARAGEVRLLAVTKTVGIPAIAEAIEAGVTDIGESRISEAKTKYDELKRRFPAVRWHMIGHLQTNKVNAALQIFDVIQSVDSLHLAEAIGNRAKNPVEIMLEVNTSGEESKHGVRPEEVLGLARAASRLSNLKITGLMTMGPLTDDEQRIRASFRELREIRDRLNAEGFKNIVHLSMGMSDDFPLAIEEGSDIIRIGRAIFAGEE